MVHYSRQNPFVLTTSRVCPVNSTRNPTFFRRTYSPLDTSPLWVSSHPESVHSSLFSWRNGSFIYRTLPRVSINPLSWPVQPLLPNRPHSDRSTDGRGPSRSKRYCSIHLYGFTPSLRNFLVVPVQFYTVGGDYVPSFSDPSRLILCDHGNSVLSLQLGPHARRDQRREVEKRGKDKGRCSVRLGSQLGVAWTVEKLSWQAR